MKTAIIFNRIGDEIKYLVFDGDKRHLHGYIIGCDDIEPHIEEEILKEQEAEPVTLEEFAQAIREGAHVIEFGFVL